MDIKDIKVGMAVKIPTTKSSISYSLGQFLEASKGQKWAIVSQIAGIVISIKWPASSNWSFLPEDLDPYEDISSLYQIY